MIFKVSFSACEVKHSFSVKSNLSMASLTAAQEAEYREAFLIFDRNGDGKITNEVIFSDEKTFRVEKTQKLKDKVLICRNWRL